MSLRASSWRHRLMRFTEFVATSRLERLGEPVPLHPTVVLSLLSLRKASAFNKPSGWISAYTKAKGAVPVWPSALMSDHIFPAVKEAGVEKHVSWHVFRGSYATLLRLTVKTSRPFRTRFDTLHFR